MATHSSVLAWKIPWTESLDGGSWWAAIYGVAQNRTQLKRPSSNSSPMLLTVILWIAACQASLSITNSQSLLAAAAKSLQSCPTLCDSIDGSPPGSPVPGILQARILEWVAISFSYA